MIQSRGVINTHAVNVSPLGSTAVHAVRSSSVKPGTKFPSTPMDDSDYAVMSEQISDEQISDEALELFVERQMAGSWSPSALPADELLVAD